MTVETEKVKYFTVMIIGGLGGHTTAAVVIHPSMLFAVGDICQLINENLRFYYPDSLPNSNQVIYTNDCMFCSTYCRRNCGTCALNDD